MTDYAEGRGALISEYFTAQPAHLPGMLELLGPPGLQTRRELRAAMYRQLLFTDGTTHQRLREVLDGPLAVQTARLEPYIRQTVGRLLKAALRQGEIDLETAFATPLAVRVLAQLLGWPKREVKVEQLARWASSLINLTTGYDVARSLSVVHQEMAPAFRFLIASKQKAITDDIARVIATSSDLADETERVLLGMVLFTAGVATVVTTLVNGLPLLLADPERLSTLHVEVREGRASLTRVVEELVRRVTPTQYVRRWSTQDSKLGGSALPAGCPVQIYLAAMNHNTKQFPNPEMLDWHRPRASAQAGFGFGVHACPGAPLARLELRIALEALLDLPHLHLKTQPEGWSSNPNQVRALGVQVCLRPES